MAVNESIWVNSIDDANFRNLAKTTTLTPRQLQINGTWGSFPYEDTWDNSICFCGMDKASGSYLANAGVVVQTHDSVLPLYKDNDITNWNFGSTNQGSGSSDGSFDNYNNWSRFANWQTPTTTGIDQTDYQGYNIKAVHSLKIKKLLLVPYIYATSVNTSSTSSSQEWTGPLHTYLGTTTIQNNYHYIRRVAFVLYYNSGTDDSPSWSDLSTSVSTRYYMQMCPHFFSDELLSAAPPSSSSVSMTTSMCIHGGIFNNQRNWHPLIGNFTKSVSEGLFRYRPILYDTDLSHYKTTGTLGSNISQIWYCRDWATDKDDILDDIRKQLAFYGMFFVGDTGFSSSSNLYDSCIYCGTIEDGITYGNYTHGIDNRLQPQWDWTDTNDSDYDPSTEPDIPDDSTEDTKNKTVLPSRGMLMPFTGSYVFDYLPLTGVINACTHHYIDMQDAITDWNLNKNEYEDSLDFESYLWRQWGRQANPVDCLQNITYYPFNIRPYMTGLTSTTVIQVGSFVQDYAGTGVIGSKVGANTTAGSIWCGAGEGSGMKFPITNADDFRSYAPYVSATLYLPFCGSIELDPQVFIGHTIKVQYLVDWRTGVCLALVYRDNLVVEAVSGQMGNKVNLQMLDGTTWASQLANASVQESNAHFNRATNFFATVGGLVKIAAGAALIVGSEGMGAAAGGGLIASGVGSVANGFIKGNQIDVAENKAAYDIGTTPIPTRQISTASPAVNASNEMLVRLVVFKSGEEFSSNYAHTVGHACLKYGTLTSLGCTGYTVCQTIDTAGITATEAEKEKIRSLLMGGVYI